MLGRGLKLAGVNGARLNIHHILYVDDTTLVTESEGGIPEC